MGKQISENRKAAYYIGMILIVVGFVLFFSVLFEGVSSVSNGPSFGPGGLQDSGPNPATALIGMVLVVVGGILRSVGARGLAGSGAILDPEQAKEELEPYSRAAGGMAKDFLEEADIKLGGGTEQVVMIRCRECGKLNEEDSKFCQECGKEV